MINDIILIGITGHAGVGKDTVRQILVEDHGFYGLAFADPVRDMARALLDHVYCGHMIDSRELKEVAAPTLGISPRQIMQMLGHEWGRVMIRPTLWIDIARAKISMARLRGEKRFVVSDVRYQDELTAIRELSGKLWHITRPGCWPTNAHASERFAEQAHAIADVTIANDGTIDELRDKVRAALENA